MTISTIFAVERMITAVLFSSMQITVHSSRLLWVTAYRKFEKS